MGIIRRTSELKAKAPSEPTAKAKWLEHIGNGEWCDLRLTPEEAKKVDLNNNFVPTNDTLYPANAAGIGVDFFFINKRPLVTC